MKEQGKDQAFHHPGVKISDSSETRGIGFQFASTNKVVKQNLNGVVVNCIAVVHWFAAEFYASYGAGVNIKCIGDHHADFIAGVSPKLSLFSAVALNKDFSIPS